MDLVQTILNLLIAGLLGTIIGTERGVFHKKEEDLNEKISFAGIRTYALISMFGGVSVLLDNILKTNFIIIIISILILTLFTLTSYIYTVFKEKQLGITTELSVFFAYFLGIFVVLGYIKFAVIFSIIVTFVLSIKESLNKAREKISRDEISNTLKFALISFVILPLLPDEKYSIFQIFQFMGYNGEIMKWSILNISFFNPYSIWYFVVLMSAISYVGYMLSKVIGEKNSIVASGAIGGLISSTAVTASMSEKSKNDKTNTNLYVVGTLIASAIMFIRVVIIVLLFNINMINTILIPAFFMLFGMGIYIIYFYRKSKKEKLNENIEVKGNYKSPFTVAPAIKFAFFVLFIKFVAAVGSEYKDIWGNYFYYALGIISGLADVDAISQTMSVDSKDGKILLDVASITIIIAVISNNIVKGTLAWRFGEKKFGKSVMGGFITSMIGGIIGLIIITLI